MAHNFWAGGGSTSARDARRGPQDPEEAHIAALKARVPSAVEAFFSQHHRRVVRTVSAILGPGSETGDVVNEVFVRALTSLPRFRGQREQLEPWLVKVAVYTARDYLRRRIAERRYRTQVKPEFFGRVASGSASQETVESLRRAYAVLEKLPAKERVPFALRYIDSMRLTDVADACGVSLATVKRHLRRARKRFDALAKDDPLLSDLLAKHGR